ncbi:MAG: dodecin domain-containing protein [Alphaproteobacteria bacterium]|nr:MAG: dodecin domain-containing protein [Alphaproteobacteria bacterium]
MSETVYRITEVVGTSDTSIEDAVETAIETAAGTLRHLDWFEVGQIRGRIVDGEVRNYQVAVRLGFRYEP